VNWRCLPALAQGLRALWDIRRPYRDVTAREAGGWMPPAASNQNE